MSHRYHQIDVTNALTANILLSNLNTTTVTNNALVANAFVLATSTFEILHGTEDALTEQAITLRFVRAVINGFRFKHLAT